MKKLRYVVVPGNEVQPNTCYLMGAIASILPPEPGKIPEIGAKPVMNMNMIPVSLEWVDLETGDVSPVVMEEIEAPSPILMPKK